MRDEFLKRLPQSAVEERRMIEDVFGITNTIRQKKAEIYGNTRLSEAGKIDDTREMAKGAPLAHLRQIRQRAANMAADTKNMRLALKPKEVDRSDIFAEMQRRELRDHLKTLPEAQRLRAAMDDPAITEAVLNAPAAVAGLSPKQLDLVREDHLEKNFGPQLRDIEKREELVETLDAAVRVATSQFSKETGMSVDEIGE